MSDNKLAMLASDVKNKEIAVLKNFISESYESLVVEKSKVYLPESVFVEYFLDFFKSNGHQDMTTPLSLKWIELAGGPYNEVTVIDAMANELYTVPSIYSKPNIDADKSNSMNFSNMASEFKLRSNRIVEDGTNYLNNQLSGVDNMVGVSDDASVNTWKAIFQRYDKSKSNDTASIAKTKPALSKLTSMLDYD